MSLIPVGNPAQRPSHDGRHRYFWFPNDDGDLAVANLVAVTLPELTDDSAHLSRYFPKDGVQGTPSFNRVENTDVTSTFDSEGFGTWSFQPEFQLYKQSPDDNAFVFFSDPANRSGLFLDFPTVEVGQELPSAGDEYYAYRLDLSPPVPVPNTTNAKQRFQLSAAVEEEPVYTGVLVAGG